MDKRSGPTFVGPDLDPYCLQRSFKNEKNRLFLFQNFKKTLRVKDSIK